MNEFSPEVIIEKVFQRVRGEFRLGMREYLAALTAVQGGFGDRDLAELKVTLELLWCHSSAQQQLFEALWVSTVRQVTPVEVHLVKETSEDIKTTDTVPEVPLPQRSTPPPMEMTCLLYTSPSPRDA